NCCPGSTWAGGAVTVNPAETAVALASSVNPAATDQAVTFTATVAVVDPGAGAPTGTVTFLDGGTVLGTATLDDTGTASLAVSFATARDPAVTAGYRGHAS